MKKILFLLSTLAFSLSYSQTQSWNTTGNSGTNPVTDFIGTTDNQPLVFKTNNEEWLRISSKGWFMTQGSKGKYWGENLFFGGGNDNASGDNTVFGLGSFVSVNYSGVYNTAVGANTLGKLDFSTNNVAIGANAMRYGGSLLNNVAIGAYAMGGSFLLGGNPSYYAQGNIAVGNTSLAALNWGKYNVAIGDRSLSDLAVNARPDEDINLYSYNIGIGYLAGGGLRKGKNNIYIGNEMWASQSEVNNELNIGNWIFGKDGDIGIGTNNPQAKVEIASREDNDSGLRFTKLNSTSPSTPNAKLLGVDANGKVVLAEGSGGGSGSDWNLTGNAGTDPSVNFIGTTDNQPVLFKTNNEERMRLAPDGKVSMGTSSLSCSDCSKFRLFVKDGVRTEKIKVDIASANNWADYVFKKDYNLMPLSEVEKHIQQKGHLPNIPSADEVMKNGIDLGEMDSRLLEKIEELTLHSIEQNKKLKEEEDKNKKQEILIENLMHRIEMLEKH